MLEPSTCSKSPKRYPVRRLSNTARTVGCVCTTIKTGNKSARLSGPRSAGGGKVSPNFARRAGDGVFWRPLKSLQKRSGLASRTSPFCTTDSGLDHSVSSSRFEDVANEINKLNKLIAVKLQLEQADYKAVVQYTLLKYVDTEIQAIRRKIEIHQNACKLPNQ